MSDGSEGSAMSDDAGNVYQEPVHVIQMREVVAREVEGFKQKLRHGSELRLFIRSATTKKDQIRAMIRCLLRCIRQLNDAGEIVMDEQALQPYSNDSERLGIDELRSNARNLLYIFKNETVGLFLDAVRPAPAVGAEVSLPALQRIRSNLAGCENLFTRVIREGYDCLPSSQDSDI